MNGNWSESHGEVLMSEVVRFLRVYQTSNLHIEKARSRVTAEADSLIINFSLSRPSSTFPLHVVFNWHYIRVSEKSFSIIYAKTMHVYLH